MSLRFRRQDAGFTVRRAGVARASVALYALVAATLLHPRMHTALYAQAGAATAAVARGSLAGTVVDDKSNKPVANAEILLPQLNRKVQSDSAGNFTIDAIPAGLHTLTISADGFAAFATRISFADGQHVESDFGLVPGTRTPGFINPNGKSAPPSGGPLAAFEDRRKRGNGRFITRDVFDAANGRKLADLIKQHVPGLTIISTNGERAAATGNRGTQSFTLTPGAKNTQKECYVQVIVDGLVAYASSPGERLFNLDNVDVTQLHGLEFYTVSQQPSQFNGTGTASCGTLLLWTRR